ncbi:MAG: FAD:protein FMN transferase [Myxococcales bacterium]|nr:FAD:protein FMN transferase [Myxococcales bacterium]
MSPLLALIAIAATPPPMYEHTAEIMTTRLVVKIALASEAERPRAEAAVAAAKEELLRLDALLSEWKPDSPLGRLNEAPTKRVRLPKEALELLQRTLQWSARTGGAFDPTFASLWGLWRFSAEDAARIPTPKEAKARAALIDYTKVIIEGDEVHLGAPGMKLGLGGIAKGYAVDRVVALLRERGFANFFIKLGGELYLAGTRSDRPWVAGVQDPRDARASFAVLALKDSAFTTSGDYERYLIKDGVRYHHIIDPSTGYPARGARSVTIVAQRAEDADALSTSVFVMGPDKGMALVESLPGVEAIMVTGDGRVLLSSGLEGKVQLRPLAPHSGP